MVFYCVALRIHCSEAFVGLLGSDFRLERRGLVEVKGKGWMNTYWLLGHTPSTQNHDHDPDLDPDPKNPTSPTSPPTSHSGPPE
jgi:hypothetical protein